MEISIAYSKRVYRCLAVLSFFLLTAGLITPHAMAQSNSSQPSVYQLYLKSEKFNLAEQIYLVLWDTDKRIKEGLAVFEKNGNRCIGRITLNANRNYKKTPAHSFKTINGSACNEWEGGSFKYNTYPKRNKLWVAWVPADFSPANYEEASEHHARSNATYFLIKETPPFLKQYVAEYKTNKELAEAKSPEELAQYSKDYNEIKSILNEPLLETFADVDLIGVWKGKFINKKQVVHAEMGIWPAKVRGFQKMYGIISFQGSQCTVGAEIVYENGIYNLGLSKAYIRGDYQKCILIEGMASIKLHKSGNILGVYLNARQSQKGAAQKNNCLDGWPQEGCYVAGVLKRAKASPDLENKVKMARWSYSGPPGPETWAIIKDNKPVPERIKIAHNKAVEYNAEVARQYKLKEEEWHRKESAKLRVEAKAEKQAEIRKRNAERRAKEGRGNNYNRGDVIAPPVVPGPFDGLAASSFLNALYKGDWSAIEKFNKYYANRKIQQNSNFWGGKSHWSDNFLKAGFKSIKLTNTVLAIYLFNYEKVYGSCLGTDAVTFEVVNHVPDTVYRNLIGVEVARFYGSTTYQYYKVNNEFTHAFRRIGRTKPEGAMSTISDFLLNQGGTDLRRELITGTKQAMSKFGCNSSEIRQIEQNLLKTDR